MICCRPFVFFFINQWILRRNTVAWNLEINGLQSYCISSILPPTPITEVGMHHNLTSNILFFLKGTCHKGTLYHWWCWWNSTGKNQTTLIRHTFIKSCISNRSSKVRLKLFLKFVLQHKLLQKLNLNGLLLRSILRRMLLSHLCDQSQQMPSEQDTLFTSRPLEISEFVWTFLSNFIGRYPLYVLIIWKWKVCKKHQARLAKSHSFSFYANISLPFFYCGLI